MPPSLNTQTVIACIWDFDKTLSPGYMQDPLFREYGVQASEFWDEVNALTAHYRERGLQVSADTAYLGHVLTYAQPGNPFAGLTNAKLRELGSEIQLAPGIPDFFDRSRAWVRDDPRYAKHGLTLEHYVVSTGFRQMIEGSALRGKVDGVWACELLADPPGPGFRDSLHLPTGEGVVSQVGYALDNTTKTRAIFEINKGVNKNPELNVNARMSEDERRVPIKNMIYVADGPSDVPVFSVVGQAGGKTLGVHTGGPHDNYDGVYQLQEDGRVQGIALADYSADSAADRWLKRSVQIIADGICTSREGLLQGITAPAGHKV